MQFETDGGALGSVVVSQVSAGRKNRLWLEIDGAAARPSPSTRSTPRTLWCGSREALTIVRRDPATLLARRRRASPSLPAGHPQGYADCFDAFVADVYDGRSRRATAPDGLPTFADGAARRRDHRRRARARRATARWVDVAQPRAVEAVAS